MDLTMHSMKRDAAGRSDDDLMHILQDAMFHAGSMYSTARVGRPKVLRVIEVLGIERVHGLSFVVLQ
jgi:hypothetical protein